MGVVYRALDTRLDRQVAIKVLPAEVALQPDRLARFEREARTLAALNHPNIAAIYGVEDAALVMELIEGPTLADRLKSGPLPLEEAVAIARQIAEALEAAHEKGVVHRDVKPDNVKTTADGTVKLLDFGLAKAIESSKHQDALDSENGTTVIAGTMTGVIMGTPGYMAPEQAKGQRVDKRADIWSFGVVLYEMLSGRRLFAAGSVAESIADVLRADVDWNALPASTPPHLQLLLKRCLDRNVRTRLRDIGEARVLLECPAAAAVPAGMVIDTSPRKAGFWPWIAAALALALPVMWFFRPKPEQPVWELEVVPPSGVSLGPPVFNQVKVSPDGTTLLYNARGADAVNRLYVRNLNSGANAALQGTENELAAVWSPDGKEIAYLADGRLKRLRLSDARVVDICEAKTSVNLIWQDDGVILTTSSERTLRKVPVTGGSLTAVFPPDRPMQGSTPSAIPGGKLFTYQLQTPSGVILASEDGVVKRQLLPTDKIRGNPASFAMDSSGAGWLLHRTPEGQLGAVRMDPRSGAILGDEMVIARDLPAGPSWSTSNTGVLAFRRDVRPLRRLTWMDRDGNSVAVLGEPGVIDAPRISPDQKSVVFARSDGRSVAIFHGDLATGNITRVSASSELGKSPAWLPHSNGILYGSEARTLVRRELSSAAPEEVLLSPEFAFRPTAVSPDETWAVVEHRLTSSPRLSFVSLRSKKIVPLEPETPLQDGTLSPDGRWLAYAALVNGSLEIFVRPVPKEVFGEAGDSGGPVQISPAGGAAPVWRADGKEILYMDPRGTMTSVSIQINGSSVKTGAPVELFRTTINPNSLRPRDFDVSADGKRFLLALPFAEAQSEVPITVIVNWPKLQEAR